MMDVAVSTPVCSTIYCFVSVVMLAVVLLVVIVAFNFINIYHFVVYRDACVRLLFVFLHECFRR